MNTTCWQARRRRTKGRHFRYHRCRAKQLLLCESPKALRGFNHPSVGSYCRAAGGNRLDRKSGNLISMNGKATCGRADQPGREPYRRRSSKSSADATRRPLCRRPTISGKRSSRSRRPGLRVSDGLHRAPKCKRPLDVSERFPGAAAAGDHDISVAVPVRWRTERRETTCKNSGRRRHAFRICSLLIRRRPQ